MLRVFFITVKAIPFGAVVLEFPIILGKIAVARSDRQVTRKFRSGYHMQFFRASHVVV